MVQQSLQRLPLLPFLLLRFELLLVLHLIQLPIFHAPALMEESSKQVLTIIFILPSAWTSVCGQGDLPRLIIEPEQEHDDVLLLLLPDLPVPNQPDHLVAGMSVQGKVVQIEPELDNLGPPVLDGAVTVQVVAGGDPDSEELVDVLLCLQPLGPGRAELGDGGAVGGDDGWS